MNGWLRQVPLRSLSPGRERQGCFLGEVRVIQGYELGRPVRQYHLGQVACCNAPNGVGYCFDVGSGECVMTWVNQSGGPPGSPACVQDANGKWIHPSCLSGDPSAPTPAPEFVAPVQEGGCPPGEGMIEGQCSPGAIACPAAGGYDLIEVKYDDPMQSYPPQPTGRILARDLPYERVGNAQGVHIVNASDPRCKTQSPAEVPAPQPAAQTVTQPVSMEVPGPIPASEAAVLPPPQPMTRQALPTGAWPGPPFQGPTIPKPVPVAKAPAPMPEACPLGPVPMADWVKGCMGILQA